MYRIITIAGDEYVCEIERVSEYDNLDCLLLNPDPPVFIKIKLQDGKEIYQNTFNIDSIIQIENVDSKPRNLLKDIFLPAT